MEEIFLVRLGEGYWRATPFLGWLTPERGEATRFSPWQAVLLLHVMKMLGHNDARAERA